MNFRVLPEVNGETAEAIAWYDDRSAGLGDKLLLDVKEAYRRIQSAPDLISLVEEYRGSFQLRRCLLRRFPYHVVFAQFPDEIVVVALAHHRREPFYWIDRLN